VEKEKDKDEYREVSLAMKNLHTDKGQVRGENGKIRPQPENKSRETSSKGELRGSIHVQAKGTNDQPYRLRSSTHHYGGEVRA